MWDCGKCGCQMIAASLLHCPMCFMSKEPDMESEEVTEEVTEKKPKDIKVSGGITMKKMSGNN